MEQMTIAQAESITGKLSKPSKMPGFAYSLPARECRVGSVLRTVPGSACFGCYAMKGNYRFNNVQEALYRRLESLNNPLWVQAMARLISLQSPDWFRWHDSGDLQSVEHLAKIVDVCRMTPNTRHWLPTREQAIVRAYLDMGGVIPENLTIRISAAMINGAGPSLRGLPVSTIHANGLEYTGAHNCPAPSQEGRCGSCRACWDKSIHHVSYHKH